jgi:hypothetical protein
MGFRMLCWEDGWMDYHPCVVNQTAINGSREMETEARGDGGGKEVFRAGDFFPTEDRTGEDISLVSVECYPLPASW